MLICRRVDCRLIAKLSPIIKNHHFIPNPPKVSKQVFPRRHPNTGLVGTFICNKIQTILMKRTLISCTQIEKVDNVDTYFFSQVRCQLVQMWNSQIRKKFNRKRLHFNLFTLLHCASLNASSDDLPERMHIITLLLSGKFNQISSEGSSGFKLWEESWIFHQDPGFEKSSKYHAMPSVYSSNPL